MPELALPAEDRADGRDKSRAVLTVDLSALAQNWRVLKRRAGDAACAAVVKADAYGLGLAPVAKKLLATGCGHFFVAHLSEAESLRAITPNARIFALNGLPPGSAALFARKDLYPVLGSLPEIEEWAAFCRAEGHKFGAALHIDTGMNRLGLAKADFPAALNLLDAFAPKLIMSHFVSAEDASAPRNRAQIERFEQACALFPAMPASLSNSSGMYLAEAPFFDLTRPGYALYGGNPTPGSDNPMRRVVSLEAFILQVRDIRAGEAAGYNARWTAPSRRRLATIGLGYADGFLRSASCGEIGAEVFAGGAFCPVVGRISMDLSIIDITEAAPLQRGDRVEILGDAICIDDLGRWSGTIGYEILTDLGRRHKRVYVGG
ncbi:alanine racemase [Rhodoblastus acidophilus]|uniref:Alanine racemase n=1 Tax=Rhodoblastus acidophilus TaxID=1074 RepID=A0A212RG53_RHOAC|nr:alanine racemase [Rhodoblastus acidophilus]MCW2316911.1 alanine racemase [Rhodoblastus acidophilus]PPQ39744.1 alanine racemase [Rhodoblastus acidophilus]RAI24502.1 alanine racemase [Rhodoblastus acidophilus]SNB71351.1 alanine racemase [Rhodoblastus acidophilus]